MAGVIGNLVYRVSVSAIVGAIVAGGLVYLSNERVVNSYRAEMDKHFEMQDLTNKALMEANEELASAVSVMETENVQRLAEFSAKLEAIGAKSDAAPEPTQADYSEILEAISAINADLSAKISDLETKVSAPMEGE